MRVPPAFMKSFGIHLINIICLSGSEKWREGMTRSQKNVSTLCVITAFLGKCYFFTRHGGDRIGIQGLWPTRNITFAEIMCVRWQPFADTTRSLNVSTFQIAFWCEIILHMKSIRMPGTHKEVLSSSSFSFLRRIREQTRPTNSILKSTATPDKNDTKVVPRARCVQPIKMV